MKRICVTVSILCLFVTSIFGYPQCCFYDARDCSTKPSPSTDCCGQQESPQPVGHCNNTGQSGCHAQKSGRKSSETTDAEDFGNKKDCKTICYRLLPPLVADGPSRSTLPNSDKTVYDIIPHQIFISSETFINATDDNPPWKIHPGITSTILRI